MRTEIRGIAVVVLISAFGCTVTAPSTKNVELQMRDIMIPEFHHRSTMTIEALRHLERIGLTAHPPIIVDYSPSRDLLKTSMITVAQDGTNPISFYQALSIVCEVSGLEWKSDGRTIRITPDNGVWNGQHPVPR